MNGRIIAIASNLILSLLMLPSFAVAGMNEPPVPKFFFSVVVEHVQQCSEFGPEIDKRLQSSLRSAQRSTAGFLPADSWQQMIVLSGKGKARIPSKSEAAYCEKIITYYSDPKLGAVLRAQFIAGHLIAEFTGCAAEFPDLAARVKKEWIAAFERNGLDPMLELYNEGVRTSWRKPSADKDQRVECEKGIRFLAGAEFDEAASAKNARRSLPY